MNAVAVVFAVCVAACIVGHFAILAAAVRGRTDVADANVPRPRRLAEIAWAVLPAIVLALVLTATWDRIRDSGTPGTPGAREVMKIAR